MLGCSFQVKTDQQALKFLLEQRATTVSQQRWISKLLGYDFVIEYKRGKENQVADALSRLHEPREMDTLDSQAKFYVCLLSFPTATWITQLKDTYLHDLDTHQLLLSLQQGLSTPRGYTLQQGLILMKGHLWIVWGSPFNSNYWNLSMPTPVLVTRDITRHFSGRNVTFIGKAYTMTLSSLCGNVKFAKPTNLKQSNLPTCSNPYLSPLTLGQILPWILSNDCLFHMVFSSFWSSLTVSLNMPILFPYPTLIHLPQLPKLSSPTFSNFTVCPTP